MAGLLGSGNAALGGDVPAVLQGHTNTGSPALLAPSQSVERPGEYILSFDPSGADSEFIRSVPLKFSATGEEGSFSEQIPGGWICQKTDTDIRLTSTGAGGLLYLMFDVRGTRYGTGGGTFASPEEVYEQCLQIWRCSRCAGTHRQMYNGAAPLAAHQRLVFVEVQAPQLCYYAGVGGSTPAGEDGSMTKESWIYVDENDGSMKSGWYYLNRNGKVEKNDWKTIGKGKYCFDSDGRMRTGWHYENGDIYYLGNGSEGYTRSGWYFLESDGKKRPAEGSVSKDLSGESENGRWYYFQSNGKARKGENGAPKETTIDGKKYYFDENGVMLTGWQCVKEKAEPGDGTGISRFVYLGGKEKGMLKGQWFETTEKPWDTKAWSTALNTQAVRKNNTDETALMKKDGSRWFYLENDGTPLFLSADATGLKDGAVKLDGRYYFFDSYGVCQSGMIKFTSGGKTETAYFDPEAGGALSIGRNTNVVDKRDKVYTFCSGTSGSEKGCGINGVKDGFLYYNGLLVSAKEGSSYEPFKVSGQVYLVNEAGKVQTEEKKYSSDGNAAYTIENGKVFTLDENGEKKSAATGLSLPYASWKIQYQR